VSALSQTPVTALCKHATGSLVLHRRDGSVGDIVVILNDNVARIMPIDECNIVRGPAHASCSSTREMASCARPIVADSRSHVTTHAIRSIVYDTGIGKLVTMLEPVFAPRASLAHNKRAALDVDRHTRLHVIIGLKYVECLQRRRQSNGSTPLMKRSQLNVDGDDVIVVVSHIN
jgi:hypothetical protein